MSIVGIVFYLLALQLECSGFWASWRIVSFVGSYSDRQCTSLNNQVSSFNVIFPMCKS